MCIRRTTDLRKSQKDKSKGLTGKKYRPPENRDFRLAESCSFRMEQQKLRHFDGDSLCIVAWLVHGRVQEGELTLRKRFTRRLINCHEPLATVTIVLMASAAGVFTDTNSKITNG